MMRSILMVGIGFALAFGGADVAAQESSTPVIAAEEAEPQRQDLTAKVPAGMPVHIDNPYGNVYLRFGGYEHAVDIHSTLQQPVGAPALTLHRGKEKGRYVIAAKLPAGAALADAQRIDIVVYVAQGHAVTVRAESDIEARGMKSDLDLKSVSGKIAVRGTEGSVQAETGEGDIQVAIAGPVRKGSKQRLATTTGNITLGATDQLNAKVSMATSAVFATEYSIDVTHDDGKEPNKWARTTVGAPDAEITLESRRGEIRLLRRAVYLEVGERPPE